jgi:phage terminase large subunit-like protein
VSALLAHVASTYSAAQLRAWRTSAERLSAGVVVGIDYPTPDHVATLCTMVLEAMADADERIQVLEDEADKRSEQSNGFALAVREALESFEADK